MCIIAQEELPFNNLQSYRRLTGGIKQIVFNRLRRSRPFLHSVYRCIVGRLLQSRLSHRGLQFPGQPPLWQGVIERWLLCSHSAVMNFLSILSWIIKRWQFRSHSAISLFSCCIISGMLPAFFFVYIIFLLCFFRVATVVRVCRGRSTTCMAAVSRVRGDRRTGRGKTQRMGGNEERGGGRRVKACFNPLFF